MRIGVLTEGSSQHLQLEAFFLSVEGSLVHNVCNLPGVLWIAGKKPIMYFQPVECLGLLMCIFLQSKCK